MFTGNRIGILSTVIIYQQKTRMGLLVSKLVSDVLWFAQYALIGFWIGNPRLSRFLSYPIALCMLTYGIANGAIMSIVNELLTIGSSIVGNIRYDFKKERPSEAAVPQKK